MHSAEFVDISKRVPPLDVQADSIDGDVASLHGTADGLLVGYFRVNRQDASTSRRRVGDLHRVRMTDRHAGRHARGDQLVHDRAAEEPATSEDSDAVLGNHH